MTNIAIIEDDKSLNHGIALALKQEDYRFYQYNSLKEVQSAAPNVDDMDLIILDINLPDGNGFEFLKALRKRSDVPVIILTANDLETDEVMGLNLGADDYMTKPFSLMVLRARIEKLLQKKAVSKAVWHFRELELDFENMKFLKAGVSVELSRTEQRLLKLLVENRGITMKREILLDRIWGKSGEYVDENALSVTVKRLRDKLEDRDRKYIHTIYGIGYVWKEQ